MKLETIGLGKRFGDFTALDQVSLTVRPGTVHALLGENGAGKSTLVKALVGYHQSDAGSIVIDGRERDIKSPMEAKKWGIGMVYQHFTVVPGMTVAENLLLSKERVSGIVNWTQVHRELQSFMDKAPFQLRLNAYPEDLSAGQKQKLEILKQMLLQPRLLVLDEPTSVLTLTEASEVLGALSQLAHSGQCSIILITHKFKEVSAYADDVTVLRKGRLVLSESVQSSSNDRLAKAMMGDEAMNKPKPTIQKPEKTPVNESLAKPVTSTLRVTQLHAKGDRGEEALSGLSFEIKAGEILGLAGVSGNGQKELMQTLCGQRPKHSGEISVKGEVFDASRKQSQRLKVRSLPEEPLQNACVAELSVAANMALRHYDQAPFSQFGWLRWGRLRQQARDWVDEFEVKTSGIDAPIRSLSGGNIQRAVLARELSSESNLLLVSNPSFGLDFKAKAEVHARLLAARQRGTAILLICEDLDELLELSDRIAVISEGRIVYETHSENANRERIGAYMAGEAH